MKGKKQTQLPSSCPVDPKWARQRHPQAETTTTHSNAGSFCLKKWDFCFSLITSGVCRNRDRLSHLWIGQRDFKGSWTLNMPLCLCSHSELTTSWRRGQTPAVQGSSGAALLPSPVSFCTGVQSCTASSCKYILNELMRKG